MAGDGDLLSEVRATARRLDDAALAALGSVGLLRRARKDVAAAPPVVTVEDLSVVVAIDGQRVTFDRQGPRAARCTCPARNVCHHVIGALLALASPDGDASVERPGLVPIETSSPAAELLDMDLAALESFAGRGAVLEAAALVDGGEPAMVVDGPTITITIGGVADVFRYAGGGLDSVICATRGRRRPMLVVAAVLAFQVWRGRPIPRVLSAHAHSSRAEPASAELAAARQSVTRKCRSALEECVTIGLAHLSPSMIDRFASLAVLAEGARLHRLRLVLDRLADGVEASIARSARSDSAVLLHECATAFALCTALAGADGPLLDRLAGRARSTYDEIPALELYGVAAHVWRSGSGHEGLTVLFWSEAQGDWWTWTDMTPREAGGLDPSARFRAACPWDGGVAPAEMIGRNLRLLGARSNAVGRLSGSSTTRVIVGSAAAVPSFRGCRFDDWKDFDASRSKASAGAGLGVHDPRRDVVVLSAQAAQAARFEGASQTLHWPLIDRNDDVLDLTLKHSEITARAIERLEALPDGAPVTVVAICNSGGGRRTIRPIALIDEGASHPIDCLDFDPGRGKEQAPEAGGHGRLADHLSGLAPGLAAAIPVNATTTTLSAVEAALLGLAQRGTGAAADARPALESAIAAAARAGLLLDRVDRSATTAATSAAERLLRLVFATRTLGEVRQLHAT